jgi:potassium efflux system protein
VIASDLRYMIDRSLRDAGIVISFPQRDVHLDLVGPVQVEMRAHADGASPRQVDTSG